MNELLEEKRALVIGGVGGIGRAISTALAEQGCHVIATAVDKQEIESSESWSAPQQIECSLVDITSADSLDALIDRTGDVDILVNCAGIIRRDRREYDLTEFSRVIDVNLIGTMRTCMAFHQGLVRRRGCVVNVASMLSFFGSASVPAYSSSKGGIAQLTKSLAIAWAPQGVRVNAIAPGWIETDLTAPLVADPERSRPLMERTPMGRWGQPQDVGGAVVFLASPWANFITGVTLPVDGGYSVA